MHKSLHQMVSERSILEINNEILRGLRLVQSEINLVEKNLGLLKEEWQIVKKENREEVDEEDGDKELQREITGDGSTDQQEDPESNLNLISDQNQILGLNLKSRFDPIFSQDLAWNPKSDQNQILGLNLKSKFDPNLSQDLVWNRDVYLNLSLNSDSKLYPKSDSDFEFGMAMDEQTFEGDHSDDECVDEKQEKKKKMVDRERKGESVKKAMEEEDRFRGRMKPARNLFKPLPPSFPSPILCPPLPSPLKAFLQYSIWPMKKRKSRTEPSTIWPKPKKGTKTLTPSQRFFFKFPRFCYVKERKAEIKSKVRSKSTTKNATAEKKRRTRERLFNAVLPIDKEKRNKKSVKGTSDCSNERLWLGNNHRLPPPPPLPPPSAPLSLSLLLLPDSIPNPDLKTDPKPYANPNLKTDSKPYPNPDPEKNLEPYPDPYLNLEPYPDPYLNLEPYPNPDVKMDIKPYSKLDSNPYFQPRQSFVQLDQRCWVLYSYVLQRSTGMILQLGKLIFFLYFYLPP